MKEKPSQELIKAIETRKRIYDFKSAIFYEIKKRWDMQSHYEKGFSREDFARQIGAVYPRACELLKNKLHRFSLEKLMEYGFNLGLDFNLHVIPYQYVPTRQEEKPKRQRKAPTVNIG